MWQYNHVQPNELMHYGKKGMKWGRKTTTSKDGTKIKTTRMLGATTIQRKHADGGRSISQIGGGGKISASVTKEQIDRGKVITATALSVVGSLSVAMVLAYKHM